MLMVYRYVASSQVEDMEKLSYPGSFSLYNVRKIYK